MCATPDMERAAGRAGAFTQAATIAILTLALLPSLVAAQSMLPRSQIAFAQSSSVLMAAYG